MRWILHADVDAFFASVEQALNPALAGRPVIVGGDGRQRTVVASCSYEARAFGVRTAMRTAEAQRLCPEAHFLPGDYRVYRKAAEAVFRLLRKLSPRVQPVSLDEAYVEIKNPREHPLEIAEGLCSDVRRRLRLPLSVGIASSRLMARLATRFAKPRGCFLLRSGYERTLLDGLPVEELPGVGHRTAEMLHGFSIHHVRDLKQVSRDLLTDTFGRRGELLYGFARGYDDRPVGETTAPCSVSRETSFEKPVRTVGVLLGMASYLLDRAMKEVLAQGRATRTLSLRIRYVDGVFAERSRTLKVPTHHEANLVPLAEAMLSQMFVRRVGVHLVGVTLSGLVAVEGFQYSLFERDREEREEHLEGALERIRDRYGFGAIIRGPAIDLIDLLPRDRDGFRLRVPSLTR